jgi:DNA-binding transcriptional MerR regulator
MSTEIRDALNAAFDQSSNSEPTESPAQTSAEQPAETQPAEPPVATDVPETKGVRERSPDGKFAPKKAETPPADPAAPPPAPAPVAETYKPPQSWKAQVRERWASLPPEVQAEVVRRERESEASHRDAAEAKKGWSQFRETVTPYEAMLRAEGVDPIRAVGSLLQTMAALRTAPPQHKAAMVANMVKSFGVPIDALDAALAGESTQSQPQAPYRDPRVDQLFSRLEQAQSARQQQMASQAQQEIQSVAGEEFFEDVREDMADLIDAASRRGVALSLKDAYSRAVKLNPATSEVLAQRDAAKAATTANAATAAARKASSSVRPNPGGSVEGNKEPDSLRDHIEAAWSARQK